MIYICCERVRLSLYYIYKYNACIRICGLAFYELINYKSVLVIFHQKKLNVVGKKTNRAQVMGLKVMQLK